VLLRPIKGLAQLPRAMPARHNPDGRNGAASALFVLTARPPPPVCRRRRATPLRERQLEHKKPGGLSI